MSTAPFHAGQGALASLQRFVRKTGERLERCELCSAVLLPDHQHLLDLEKHSIACACEPCAVLLGGSAKQHFRRIPRDCWQLQNFTMESGEWESLLIPINLAFFVQSSAAGKTIAQYPSPGGIMESSLDLDYWKCVVERNPVLASFEPDVEALLVNRLKDAPLYYRAPIDQCFRLCGMIRMRWRGLSGGSEVWTGIDRFFEELAANSRKA